MSKAETRKDKASDENKSLGVLYTGYLEKKNPVTGSFKKRFVVLTQNSIHWFKRAEGDDLFGEERGQFALGNILTTRILDEDSTIFEIQGTDSKKRYFRAATNVFCEEWVSAVRSAIKSNARKPSGQRRATISGVKFNIEDEDKESENYEKTEVSVLLVSLNSAAQQTEIVIARHPEWDRVINVPAVKKGDQIIISTSNGGSVILPFDNIISKAESGSEFESAVQNVPLASSLKISVSMQGFDKSGSTETMTENRRLGKRISANLREQISDFAAAMITDRSFAINTVLSMMVIMAGISSIMEVGSEASLLYLFAGALSIYNIYQVVEEARVDKSETGKSINLRLVIHGHTFTSPDAPVTDLDSDIPQRFIDGCNGDMKEARMRWDITKHWRESEGVNNILEEPQPYFHLIKAMYPHYHCGIGKSGHRVYWERPGDFEAAQLAARGVKLDDLVRHWLFMTEYQWQVLCNNDETAKSIAVIDLNNIKIGDLAGDNLAYLKKTVSIANQHYPERSYAICIINAPFFFSMMWKLVKPLVHENTQKKIRILNAKETLTGLQEVMDISQIPEFYGGEMRFDCSEDKGKDSCRFHCSEVLQMNEFVRKLNEGNSIQSKVPFEDTSKAAAVDGETNLPPGNPGDLPPSKSDAEIAESPMPAYMSRSSSRRGSLGAPKRASVVQSPGGKLIVFLDWLGYDIKFLFFCELR